MSQVSKYAARAGWETYSMTMEDAERRKGVPTETVGTSGGYEIKLRADEQVWRIFGEFEGFGKLSV